MIYTDEKLVDPVQFITENVDITPGLEAKGFEIVSGTDFDVLISGTDADPEEDADVREFDISPVLGNLYTGGSASVAKIGKSVVYFNWLPSPAATNELSERLDRTPGVDVLRFTHSQYDYTPGGEYNKHLKNYEYPLSTGRHYFIHDRGRDHAPGVLLAPSALLDCIKYWNHKRRLNIITYFDAGTTDIGSVHEQIYRDGNDARYYLGFASELLARIAVMRGPFGSIRKHFKMNDPASLQPVHDEIERNFAELMPRIERLKAEKDTSN